MPNRLLRILMTVLLFVFAVACHCQSSNYRFRYITLPEIYKDQFIKMVDRDDAGMLWFVTNNGLHRYDGNIVLTLDLQSTPALPDINIRYLFADRHHNLWLATQDKLFRLDLQHWTIENISFPSGTNMSVNDHKVSSIGEGADSTLYVGLANGKLCVVSQGRMLGLVQLQKHSISTDARLPGINVIREPIKGMLLLGTDQGQLVTLRHVGHRFELPFYFEPPATAFRPVASIVCSNSGKCLIQAQGNNFFRYDYIEQSLKELSLTGLTNEKNNTICSSELGDDKAALFFAGHDVDQKGFGLYDINADSFTNLASVYPVAFRNSVFRNAKYKNGQILVATDHGIGSVVRFENPFHVSMSGLENINSIRTIHKFGNNVFVGAYQERFLSIDELTGKKQQLSSELVSSMLHWNKDTFLAATSFPCWYIAKTNRFFSILAPNATTGLNNNAQCLFRENDSLVWVGTLGGCYSFDPRTGHVLTNKWSAVSVMEQLEVFTILRVGNSRYFATVEGIFKQDVHSGYIQKLFVAHDSSYANANVTCLQLVNGLLWAGTKGKGIIVFDTTGTIRRNITMSDGLASNIIFSLPACAGFVIAGTGSGLSIIQEKSNIIRSYSSLYYLPANEFNRSAWFVDGDAVYMGTINGMVKFEPGKVMRQAARHRPSIRLSGIVIGTENGPIYDYSAAYRSEPEVKILAGTKYFSISFGGLDEADAELDLYYRLDSSSTWQSIGQQREITFVGMAPDKYRLQVAAHLPDGSWLDDLLVIPLEIRPAFYQTWYFKTMIAMLCIFLIWLAIRYREKNLRKEQQLRSRIAGDLHDEVGSALTRIYFQADLLATKSAPSPALKKISISSQEALSSMNDMVWSIDARYDNLTDMVGRMRNYLAKLQDDLDCSCVFELSGSHENKHINQISRQNIFLIFKEAVTNAIKYGQDKKVVVKLLFNQHDLKMTIQNQMPIHSNAPVSAHGGHGLKGMRLRAEKIKAVLLVERSIEVFTVILDVEHR